MPSEGQHARNSCWTVRVGDRKGAPVFSMYNVRDRCFAHAPIRFPRLRGRTSIR